MTPRPFYSSILLKLSNSSWSLANTCQFGVWTAVRIQSKNVLLWLLTELMWPIAWRPMFVLLSFRQAPFASTTGSPTKVFRSALIIHSSHAVTSFTSTLIETVPMRLPILPTHIITAEVTTIWRGSRCVPLGSIGNPGPTASRIRVTFHTLFNLTKFSILSSIL